MSQSNPENPGLATAAETAICFAKEDLWNRLTEELRAAKAEAERANKRSSCLAVVNHDLRQPLQTICFIQGMLASSVSDPKARTLIERLDQAVVSMSQILDRLVEIDREEPERPESGIGIRASGTPRSD